MSTIARERLFAGVFAGACYGAKVGQSGVPVQPPGQSMLSWKAAHHLDFVQPGGGRVPFMGSASATHVPGEIIGDLEDPIGLKPPQTASHSLDSHMLYRRSDRRSRLRCNRLFNGSSLFIGNSSSICIGLCFKMGNIGESAKPEFRTDHLVPDFLIRVQNLSGIP